MPGLTRIVRALLIGVGIFVLLSASPRIMLWLAGVHIPQAPVIEEKVFHDTSGKPVNEPDHFIAEGYERAAKEGIHEHSDCRAYVNLWERRGCFNYVSEHFSPPHVQQGNADGVKTTAQCQEEVSRYWEYRMRTEQAMGNDRYISKDYPLEMKHCENYDNIGIAIIVQPYLNTLEPLIKRNEDGGGRLTDAEREQVVADLTRVTALPNHPFRTSYIERSQYLFDLADGKVEPRGKERLKLSCTELRAGLNRLEADDNADAAAIKGFERPDGIVENPGGRGDALNQRRINRLWDFSRYEYNLKRLRCAGTSAIAKTGH